LVFAFGSGGFIIRWMAKSKRKEFKDNDRDSGADQEILLSSSDPEAKQLYDLAIRVKSLAPWRWMEETDVFGVANPQTNELGFVSIMGSVGEYEAVAVYLGAEGLYDFIDCQADESATPQRLIEMHHLQVEFSDRKYLEKEDRDLIKQLALKFKGPSAWPMFRSYRPGYVPWFVTCTEARMLIHVLSQVLDVATHVRDDPDPIQPVGRVEPGGHWVRAAHEEGTKLIWEDQVWKIQRPKPESLSVTVETDSLELLKHIPRSNMDLEVDLLLTPGRVAKPGQRPLALYVLMIAESKNGLILGAEPMTAERSLSEMHEGIPNALLKALLQNQVIPERLLVRTKFLHGLLRSLTQSLNIELRHANELPSIDEAAAFMLESMFGGEL
jgi:Domain of unknown function (DUF6930)